MSDNAYVTVINNMGGQEVWDSLTNSERAKYMFEYHMNLMKQEADRLKQESDERIKIINERMEKHKRESNERMEKHKRESDERIAKIKANGSSRIFSNVIGLSTLLTAISSTGFHGYSALSTCEH